MTRRELLASAALAAPAAAAAAPGGFTFVHFTDTHIQPELRAEDGCLQCFEAINREKPDFSLAGGDLVFDSAEVPAERGKKLYGLYGEAVKRLHAPVHTAIGNHDVFGLDRKSGVETSDPLYGKKMFEERIGKLYWSFDHKGWHFIVLDSIGMTPDRQYYGYIDEAQLDWLKRDLEATGATKPVIAVTHVPLVTAYLTYGADSLPVSASGMIVTNAKKVVDLFAGYNVKMVLQGHTHVRESVLYKGCQYITSGAVSGNWWKGLRLGHPEGFGVIRVQNGEARWSYRTYGFKAAGA